jgi:hypothetical protein
MTGEEIYVIYCESCAHLSETTRRGEALPAWAFLPTEQKRVWDRIARQIEERYA